MECAGGQAAARRSTPLPASQPTQGSFLSSRIVGTAGLEPLPLAPQSVSCVPARLYGL